MEDVKRVSKRILAFGGYVPEDEKHRATDIMMSIAEYERRQTEIRSLKAQVADREYQIKQLEEAHKRDKMRLEREYEQQLEEERAAICQEYESRQKKLDIAYKRAKVRVEEWENLNKNLLRIMKERANSKRGLQPKKERSGYLILSSQEYQYIYKSEIVVREARFNKPEITRTVTNNARCYKTILQSPYDAKLPLNEVKSLIFKDFGQAPLKYLGIAATHLFDESLLKSKKNYMFKADVRANFRSGLMEMEFLTNKEINIPSDLVIPEK